MKESGTLIDKIEKIIKEHTSVPLGKQRLFSVLLPLIQHKGEWHVLYEVRSQNISQPGETAFPGGAVEEGETFEETSIRETMEELNIKKENIRVLGEIDYIVSDFAIIHCFVGEIKNIQLEQIQFNEEVEELFVIPLDYLLENKPHYYSSESEWKHPENFPYHLLPNGKKHRLRPGKHSIPFYNLEKHSLWGFTANMTDCFINIIQEKN